MNHRSKIALAAVVVATTAGALSSPAIGLIGGHEPPLADLMSRQAAATAPDPGAAADAAGVLDVLTSPPGTGDARLSADSVRTLPRQAALNVGLARHALTTPRGTRLFVLPGDGYACLVDVEPSLDTSATCNTLSEMTNGRLTSTTRSLFYDDQILVDGLVPDGVSAVRVTMRDGSEAVVSVRNNAYALETAKSPTRVSWELGGVERSARLVVRPHRIPR